MSAEEKTKVGPSTKPNFTIAELKIVSELPLFVEGVYEPDDFYHPFNYEFEPPKGAYLYIVIHSASAYPRLQAREEVKTITRTSEVDRRCPGNYLSMTAWMPSQLAIIPLSSGTGTIVRRFLKRLPSRR